MSIFGKRSISPLSNVNMIMTVKNPKYIDYSPKVYDEEDRELDYDKLILDIDDYKDKEFNLYPELPIY